MAMKTAQVLAMTPRARVDDEPLVNIYCPSKVTSRARVSSHFDDNSGSYRTSGLAV